MNYQDAVKYLYSLGNEVLTAKLGLQNITTLLDYLGKPQQRFQSVLIAGTNGKGSVAAFCESMLRQSGIKTGLYTSPHLVRIEERIRSNGEMISPARFARLTEQVKHAIADLMAGGSSAPRFKLKRHPTYFEVVTAIAFLHFAESGVERAVLEVGMGGRFDATNVVDPLVAVVTNVDYDHQRYLGHRLEGIAWEKAGIIKPRETPPVFPDGRADSRMLPVPLPVVTASENPVVLDVLEKECRLAGARLIRTQSLFQYQQQVDRLERYHLKLRCRFGEAIPLDLPLPGAHQVDNVLSAVAVMEILAEQDRRITAETVSRGISRTVWPGRLEVIDHKPQIILDGAHNPAGTEKVCAFAQKVLQPEKTVLIFAVMQDKAFQEMARKLFPMARLVLLPRLGWSRAADPELVQAALLEFAGRIQMAATVKDAIAQALATTSAEDSILIAGSLFLVGEARDCLFNRGLLPGDDLGGLLSSDN